MRVVAGQVLLHDEFGLTGEVVLAQFHQGTEAGLIRLSQAVGVLTHNQVTLLQSQDPLGLNAERCDAEIFSNLKQSLPHVQPVGGWHMDFEAEFTGESDAPDDAVGDPGDGAGTHLHVTERFRVQVDIGHPTEQLTRIGSGDVHTAERSRQRGDRHLPLGVHGLQPHLKPVPDRTRTRRCRRHQVVVIAKTAGDPVIHDDAIFGAHHAVPHRADGEVVPIVGVHQIQQLDHIRTMQIELAQRGQVDDADIGANVDDLGRRVSIVLRPDPLAGHHIFRAMLVMPALNRRHTVRLEDAARKCAEADRSVRRPPHGGSGALHVTISGLGEHGHRVDVFELALGGAHACRGEALGQFGRVVALLGGGNDVLALHVLGVVEETDRGALEEPKMGVGNQCRDIFRRLAACTRRGFGAYRPTVCDQFRGAAVTNDAAGRHHPGGRHSTGSEPRRLRVPHRAIAGHVQQAGRGGPSGCGNQQICGGRGSVAGLDRAEFPATDCTRHILTLARVENTSDLDAGAAKSFDGLVAGGICGEHDRPATRPHGMKPGETKGRGGKHDAGQVISLEDVRALDQAGGNHQGADPGFDQTFPGPDSTSLHNADPVVVVAAQDHRVGEHLDIVEARDLRAKRSQRCERFGAAVAEVTAQFVLLFDQHHVGTGAGSFDRGRHTCRAAAGDQNIRVREAFVEDLVRGPDGRGVTAGGEL